MKRPSQLGPAGDGDMTKVAQHPRHAGSLGVDHAACLLVEAPGAPARHARDAAGDEVAHPAAQVVELGSRFLQPGGPLLCLGSRVKGLRLGDGLLLGLGTA